MNRFIVRCLPLAVSLLVSLPLWRQPAAQGEDAAKDSDAFFKSGKVVELAIELDTKELEALRRQPRTYAKATLKEGDRVYKEVGIHLKGAAGSFRGIDEKPGLTLNMDKFVDDQRFHGMDKFHLANSVQDPSYLEELISGELFRASGVPASRISHALVTINGKRRGLYYLKEGYDSAFLTRHFGSKNGNFYDGGFLRDLDQPLQLLSGKNDVANHADLKALMAAAREGDLTLRFQKLEKLLDLDRFVSFLALEVILWDWDGYPLNRNNYRVYHDPKRDKITFVPSGMDQMFRDVNGPVLPNFQGQIARGLLETPKGRERYLDRLAVIMKDVYHPNELSKRLDELQMRIQPALASVDAGAGRDYSNQIKRLRDAISQRQKVVEGQLKRMKQ